MSRISVRGFAVASATAVTTVGAVVGVASGTPAQAQAADGLEATAADSTLLADIPAGGDTQVQTVSLTQQADAQSDAANATARQAAQETARKQAAEQAAAKKAAAEKKAAEAARQKAADRASRSSERTTLDFAQQAHYTTAEVQAMARKIVGAGQYQCFSNIVTRESGWNYQATNAASGAYGLVQALPGSKMSSAGADWRTNPATQIKWGLNYMNSRYDSPCGAWSFWQANHYY